MSTLAAPETLATLALAHIFHASRTPGQNHSVFDVDEQPARELPELRRLCWAAGAVTPSPTWVAGHICVIARARCCYLIYGERNWRMACAKTSTLGQLEARYRRMRRVLRVTTGRRV